MGKGKRWRPFLKNTHITGLYKTNPQKAGFHKNIPHSFFKGRGIGG
jgi:hypothetical protein